MNEPKSTADFLHIVDEMVHCGIWGSRKEAVEEFKICRERSMR